MSYVLRLLNLRWLMSCIQNLTEEVEEETRVSVTLSKTETLTNYFVKNVIKSLTKMKEIIIKQCKGFVNVRMEYGTFQFRHQKKDLRYDKLGVLGIAVEVLPKGTKIVLVS